MQSRKPVLALAWCAVVFGCDPGLKETHATTATATPTPAAASTSIPTASSVAAVTPPPNEDVDAGPPAKPFLWWCRAAAEKGDAGAIDSAQRQSVNAILKAVHEKNCDRAADLLAHSKTLDLSGCNPPEDIEPIASLTQLEELSLHRDARTRFCEEPTSVRSLAPLRHLTHLSALDLENQPIQGADTRTIARLVGLRRLRIGTEAQEPSPRRSLAWLSPMIGLEQLSITSDEYHPWTLPPLPQLQVLRVCTFLRKGEQRTDPGATFVFPNLRVLEAQLQASDDLEKLPPQPKLAVLVASSGPIPVSTLVRHPVLEEVDLESSPSPVPFDPTGLDRAGALARLMLRGPVRWEALPQLPTVRQLFWDCESDGAQAPVPLTFLARMPNLERLRVLCNVTGLSALASVPGLRSLALNSGAPLTSLEPIGRLSALTDLDIGGDGVTDLAPLATLSKLRRLRADGNAIRDLSPLRALPSLCEASFTGNPKLPTKDIAALDKLLRTRTCPPPEFGLSAWSQADFYH